MHPTVDEQLRGVRRLLDGVVATEGDGLSPPSAAALHDARTILRRLESSWSAVLPFLDWDNRATEALLAELAGLVPGDAPAAVAATDAGPDLEFEAAHQRNLDLRARLVEAVRALGAGPDLHGEAAARVRARVAAHLRERLQRDPSNRRTAAAAPEPEGGR